MEPFMGQIALVSFSFAPQGWAFCHGQLLPISEHQALFSLLGTTHGGDGSSTFALPDLTGRVPVGASEKPGSVNLGQTSEASAPSPGQATLGVNVNLGQASRGKEESATSPGHDALGLNYIIALQGVFPNRDD
ncbi:MAG: phage tail protein [Pseudonocardiaceae bacterium]